jgi:hypothetical protein
MDNPTADSITKTDFLNDIRNKLSINGISGAQSEDLNFASA